MAPLADLQQAFAEAVLDTPDAGAAFVAGGAALARERVAIYRNTIFANYRKALSATYPVVRRLAGAPSFNAAVAAFVRAHPSTSGDLNVYGGAFGDFLAGHAPVAELLPYLADVARLEWAIDEAHRASDAVFAPQDILAALAAAPLDRLPALRLRLEPSCRLVVSAHPILRIWRSHQTDDASEARVAFGEGADRLLVRRDAHGVSVERLEPGEHAWLAALAAGSSLGGAIGAAQEADRGFDLGTALQAHIGAGTIMAVDR